MFGNGLWHALLANFALVVIFVSISTHTYGFRSRWPGVWPALSLGIIFGLGAGAVILLPVETIDGIFFDLRASLLGLAAFFGGPIAALVAGGLTICVRLGLGGAGAPAGTFGITLATLAGLAGWALVGRRAIRRTDVLLLSVCLGAIGTVGFLFLPDAIRAEAMAQSALPIALLVAASTALSGLAMRQERQRQLEFDENLTFRTIIEHLPDSLNVKDRDGRFIAANSSTAKLMGAASAAELIGKRDADFYPPEVARQFATDEAEAMRRPSPVAIEQEIIRPDAEAILLSTLKVPVRNQTGELIALITHNRDITERRRLELQLATTEARLAGALSSLSDGLVMFDRDGRLVFCNERYREMFPRTAELRIPGAQLRDILRASIERGEQLGIAADAVDLWIDGVIDGLGVPGAQEVERYDGRWLHVRTAPLEDGRAVVLVSDITKVKQAELALLEMTRRLEVLASTDGLTGLLNRRAFDQALAREVGRCRRGGAPISLLMVDIDRFKTFNDAYGHPMGDACLRQVAGAFAGIVKRPGDVTARYGGEELVAILPETDAEGALHLARAYGDAVRALAIPHAGSEKGVVTVSIGVATYENGDPDCSAPGLVQRADEALYAAKASGRDAARAWEPPGEIAVA